MGVPVAGGREALPADATLVGPWIRVHDAGRRGMKAWEEGPINITDGLQMSKFYAMSKHQSIACFSTAWINFTCSRAI